MFFLIKANNSYYITQNYKESHIHILIWHAFKKFQPNTELETKIMFSNEYASLWNILFFFY